MGGRKSSIEAKLAEFVADLRFEKLSAEVVHDAKYRVLDWLGSALAGVRYKPSLLVTNMIRSCGGTPQATVLKAGLKVSAPQAAFANGTIGHAAEFDDGHRQAITHPGAIAVPTSLAVAESLGRTGKEMLAAVVAGYEVMIRLGSAINPSHYRVWHTTGTCGAFAAAASAASLFKLDKRQVQMALGIAGTMASGLQETFGTHAKPLNAGHACQSGIQAALLARDGFTGPDAILVGPKGFIAATSPDCDLAPLGRIDNGHLVANTAFYKIYASCGHTNSPLDAIFSIMRRQDIVPADVKAVRITTYRVAVDLTGQLKHETEESAKFSLPYCTAIALLHKRVTLAEFTQDKLADPAVVDLAGKIEVSEDPEATNVFPKERRATVTIEMINGRTVGEKVYFSHDTPEYSHIDEKFMSLSLSSVDEKTAEIIKHTVLNLENVDDIHCLMAFLR